MASTKVPPPRKLTENEDNDSFDDFWFQPICYYSRDEAFKPIFDDLNYSWQATTVQHRGLRDADSATKLNTLSIVNLHGQASFRHDLSSCCNNSFTECFMFFVLN